VSSSSLKRHVNFSVLDDFVEWDEDGITATITANINGNALANMIKDAGFENTFISSSSSMITNNELLKTLGSDWRVEDDNLLSMMSVQTVKDSSIYVIIVTYPKKGEPIYTDVIPMGKCGTKAYSKRTQFCDTRGTGTIYKMVTIGTQTWIAENLNYATAEGSYCYNDDPDNCDTYGRLYDWDVAVSTTSPVCPTGWRIPSLQEYKDLIVFVDNDLTTYSTDNKAAIALKSTTSWAGSATNASGFNLLLTGKRNSSGSYERVATQVLASDDKYSYLLVNNTSDIAWANVYTSAVFARSVRCIKN
jgi:uncharacterized protein (TIGR02145 family)